MTGRGIHRASTLILSLLMAVIGVALLAQAIGQGGSVLSPRLLLGLLFVAAGAGRLYILKRKGSQT
ncbi:MAG TPA: hypothetical protein VMG80_07190 [Solirubrobacteraceae bacterium]|nr:hypothetical protein [Solirubrobacteraceae bacterium]